MGVSGFPPCEQLSRVFCASDRGCRGKKKKEEEEETWSLTAEEGKSEPEVLDKEEEE